MNIDQIIIFKSKIGNILISTKNNKITKTDITQNNIYISNNDLLINAKKQILEYLSSKRKVFNLPISPSGTDFQKKVWNEILKIPYGTTTSYYNISNILKSSPRAIGHACGRNPILIFIPCHRVVSKSSNLTGFSALGGIKTKRNILKIESSLFNKNISYTCA